MKKSYIIIPIIVIAAAGLAIGIALLVGNLNNEKAVELNSAEISSFTITAIRIRTIPKTSR